ncbi:Rpn family recombination-promoting nuclease/putative transposase [Nocardia higoensis]|uniref:Rpn family recombination-promoting nuclease/putative transposase n=1 Tax=Nocardia higoensis TaxID=228599 RepID=UPI0002FCDC76|nr:Rpn family recombination-promoting nuclease/putative transposase [Nocardia higoensis]
MAVTPPNPHDALFRHIMSRPHDAVGELRAALPEAISARIRWETLTPQPCNFVSTRLRSRYSDVLFHALLDDHDAFIYVLIEHQTRPDRFMPLRMIEYMAAIWNRYLGERPEAATLPPIVPVVVHSGPHSRRWNTPTELSELIGLAPDTRLALGEHLPRLRLVLDDLTTVDVEALRRRALTPAARLMFVLHKIAAGNPHLGADLAPLVDDLHALIEAPGGIDDLTCLVTYIFMVGETSEDDLAPVIEQLGPRAKEVLMTTAEKLQAKGRAKGRDEGRAEGRAEERAEALTDLLTVKFGPLPADVTARIGVADTTRLRTWFRAALTASTLEEVFT